MLKNSTKITSLLVAAASMATMVPAMAATEMKEKDGTVYNAVAYKDGKFYIDGEIDDNNAVYFLNDGKYTELDDLDTGDDVVVYGEKYAKVDDGDAYVDLSNGKVNDDDDLESDDKEDAKNALEKKIKKDAPGRYVLNDTTDKPENLGDAEIKNAPYAENYYEFKIDGKYTIYSDKDGKYIDADHELGKIKLIVSDASSVKAGENTTSDSAGIALCNDKGETLICTTTGDAGTLVKFEKTEAVTIENTKDLAKFSNKKFAVKARLSNQQYLTQDKDYIYRKAELAIDLYQKYATGDITDGDYGRIAKDIQSTNDLAFGGVKDIVKVKADKDKGTITVIQKISKAQDGDVDDAKTPKSTDTYFFNEYKDFAAKDSKKYDKRLAEARVDLAAESDAKSEQSGWSVVDGKLVNYRFDGSNFKAQVLTLKNKAGFYYMDKDDKDFDVDDDEFDVAVDKDGNVWALDNGKVKMYKTSNEFDTVYKCDGAMNRISVYDKDNIIVWNEDEDQYAIVGGKSTTKSEGETTDTTTTTAQVGWYTNADGSWSYGNADGTKAIGWLQSPTSGLWYYMDANGIMMSNGWVQDGAYWYFLGADGAMKTGWVYTNGAWYYLKETAGNKGAMQTGWIQTGGKWYYCNASGAMLSNTTVNGYKLGADGAWIK